MNFLVGLLVIALAMYRYRCAERLGSTRWRRVVRVVCTMIAMAAVAPTTVGFYMLVCTLRPTPAAVDRELFDGVTYRRRVVTEPSLAVVHVIEIDTTKPGTRYVVTPPDRPGEKYEMRLRKTSDFASASDVDIAINANYYSAPDAIANHIWDLMPRAGRPAEVLGIAASDGVVYGKQWYGATLYLNDHRVGVDRPQAIDEAVSGIRFMVRDGKPVRESPSDVPDPRTVVALDAERRTLWLIVVDGRQPGYSVGMRRYDVAQFAMRLGARDAIELDGGGSTTLVVRDDDGVLRVLNSPIHTRLPGRQRPVANHLGVRVARRSHGG